MKILSAILQFDVITHGDVDFILGDVAIDLVGFSDHLMLSLNLNLIKDLRSTLKTTKQRSFVQLLGMLLPVSRNGDMNK